MPRTPPDHHGGGTCQGLFGFAPVAVDCHLFTPRIWAACAWVRPWALQSSIDRRLITTTLPQDIAEDSSQLFLEASRLEDLAYDLISQSPVTQNNLDAFREAKLVARANYLEARDAWTRGRREHSKQN